MRRLLQSRGEKKVERFNEHWQCSLFLASYQNHHIFGRKTPKGPWAILLVL